MGVGSLEVIGFKARLVGEDVGLGGLAAEEEGPYCPSLRAA
jgi:hypothetical protein